MLWSSSSPGRPKLRVLPRSRPFVLVSGRESWVLGQTLLLVSLCARLGGSPLPLARPPPTEAPPLLPSQLLGLILTACPLLPNWVPSPQASLPCPLPPVGFRSLPDFGDPSRWVSPGLLQEEEGWGHSAECGWELARDGVGLRASKAGRPVRLEGLFPNGPSGWMDFDL